MTPLEVRVGNNPTNTTSPPQRSGNLLCSATTNVSTTLTLKCRTLLRGRYVSVQRIALHGAYLTLCEVKVIGDGRLSQCDSKSRGSKD